jgi:hypothetical protein
MQPFLASVPALSVSAIFLLYHAYCQFLVRHHQRQVRLRERVAYMLWVMATRDDAAEPPDAPRRHPPQPGFAGPRALGSHTSL